MHHVDLARLIAGSRCFGHLSGRSFEAIGRCRRESLIETSIALQKIYGAKCSVCKSQCAIYYADWFPANRDPFNELLCSHCERELGKTNQRHRLSESPIGYLVWLCVLVRNRPAWLRAETHSEINQDARLCGERRLEKHESRMDHRWVSWSKRMCKKLSLSPDEGMLLSIIAGQSAAMRIHLPFRRDITVKTKSRDQRWEHACGRLIELGLAMRIEYDGEDAIKLSDTVRLPDRWPNEITPKMSGGVVPR